MLDLSTTATLTPVQTEMPCARSVTTKDGRYTVRFPLPPTRSGVAKPRGVHLRVILRDINRLLNLGHTVEDPTTGGLIKIYRRGLHQSQVSTLKRLRDRSDKYNMTYVHVELFTARRDGDLAKMAMWDLIEPLKVESRLEAETGRGKWRITPRGRAWLNGTIRIPRQVALLFGERLGYVNDADLIGPEDAAAYFKQETLEAGNDGKETTP